MEVAPSPSAMQTRATQAEIAMAEFRYGEFDYCLTS